MARTLMRHLATPPAVLGPALVATLVAALVAGCATTDELYAEYDATLCPVFAEAAPAMPGRIRYLERASGEEVRWPPSIYFGYDSDALDRWALAELEAAAELLNRHPQLNVMLTGYTSRLGSAAYNAKLASRRVSRVIDRLDAAGITRSRLLPLPIGMGLPEFTSDERVANAVNRRVGLTLLDRSGRPVAPGYGESALAAGALRVGPDWPPNEVEANVPPRIGAAVPPPVRTPLAPLPGPVDPWSTGGAGTIGGAPASGAGVGDAASNGAGGDVR